MEALKAKLSSRMDRHKGNTWQFQYSREVASDRKKYAALGLCRCYYRNIFVIRNIITFNVALVCRKVKYNNTRVEMMIKQDL